MAEPRQFASDHGDVADRILDAARRLLLGAGGAVSADGVAGAIARVAVSHYMFPDTDSTAMRRQIRAAAGLPDSPGQGAR